MKTCYDFANSFMKKYPLTMAWRIKAHSKVIDNLIAPDEEILYVVPGQYNETAVELFNTYLLVFTNKRIILAKKRILFGYFFKSITPDMYNDLTVNKALFWGRIIIDTVKEVITITNIDAKALPEIDNNINEIITKQKKDFASEKNSK